MRRKVNTKLPKAVEDIERWMEELKSKGKEFLIHGMTFDELNERQENEHDQQVQEEKDRKKEEKKKMMVQESIYGVNAKTIAKTITKTPIRSGNRTLKQVKRLQHDSKVVSTYIRRPQKYFEFSWKLII